MGLFFPSELVRVSQSVKNHLRLSDPLAPRASPEQGAAIARERCGVNKEENREEVEKAQVETR